MDTKNLELSEVLRRLRDSKGFSLRQLEKVTGISNAYLSQLETGKTGNPSPHILHKLADIYETSYQELMILAGYISQKEGESAKEKIMNDVAFSTYSQLTSEEKEKVLEYLSFIRNKRGKK